MKILIAEDDAMSRTVLERTLKGWGYSVVIACDGLEAWEHLQSENAAQLAILDWMMPELDGAEVCRRVRTLERTEPPYLILLTARQQKEDIVTGLESGANDYVVKPFDRRELQARVRVGERMIQLQHDLAERVRELQLALAQVHQLQGLLPICCYCKKIRDDRHYWQQVETYVGTRADVQFSHGICPECYATALAVIDAQMAQPSDEIAHATTTGD